MGPTLCVCGGADGSVWGRTAVHGTHAVCGCARRRVPGKGRESARSPPPHLPHSFSLPSWPQRGRMKDVIPPGQWCRPDSHSPGIPPPLSAEPNWLGGPAWVQPITPGLLPARGWAPLQKHHLQGASAFDSLDKLLRHLVPRFPATQPTRLPTPGGSRSPASPVRHVGSLVFCLLKRERMC